MKRLRFISAGIALSAIATFSWAEAALPKEKAQTREQLTEQYKQKMGEQEMYGWQLMTPEERAQHRERMQKMENKEERQAYLEKHHARLQQRAQERGVKLPEPPRYQVGKGPMMDEGHMMDKGSMMEKGRKHGTMGGEMGQGKN